MAIKLEWEDWARDPTDWKGRFEGRRIGTGITVLFFSNERIGSGPVLHRHPYDEVFIIRQGHARFTIGDEIVEAKAGDILLAPAGTPHKFENIGPGRLESTDIHVSPEFIQEDLE
ncbi:cupin domain-containing protein [Rhodobacterales bacterium HKCCSP123]|nr:cupin domain-containing protein [Rhodobacterales bacterium HKCCSP123]